MQVVRVEFVVDCEEMLSLRDVSFGIDKASAEQKAVDFVKYILSSGIMCPSKYLESWNVIEVSDREKGSEYKLVEDGEVQNV
jgi:hypothetical protein